MVVRGSIENGFQRIVLRDTFLIKWPPVMEGIVKLLLNSREKTTAVLLWFLPVEREAVLLERSGVTPVVVR